MPRSKSARELQRVRPRYGPARTQRAGQSQVGGGGRRPLSVERFPAGHRDTTLCPHCTEAAEHAARRPPTTELPFSTPAGGRPSQAREDEHGWWCWRRKWEDVSQKTFVHALAKAKSRNQPPILRGCVRAASPELGERSGAGFPFLVRRRVYPRGEVAYGDFVVVEVICLARRQKS